MLEQGICIKSRWSRQLADPLDWAGGDNGSDGRDRAPPWKPRAFYPVLFGAAAVMVILTFKSLGLPLPGESVLILASVLAGRGELSLLPLMLGAWAGAVLGDNMGI